MGNVFSSTEKSWHIQLTEGSNEIKRVNARYLSTQPPIVNITGPCPLDCVIEVSNAVIEIEGNGHRVSVHGRNNTIRINASETFLRIEGTENKVSGTGEGATLFTDAEVTVEGITLAGRENFNAANASPNVSLLENLNANDDSTGNDSEDDLQPIRFAYRSRNNGGGGGDAPSTNEDSVKPTPSDTEKGGVKRDAEDSDDESNDAERKRARAS